MNKGLSHETRVELRRLMKARSSYLLASLTVLAVGLAFALLWGPSIREGGVSESVDDWARTEGTETASVEQAVPSGSSEALLDLPPTASDRQPAPLPDEQYEVLVEVEARYFETALPASQASIRIDAHPLYRTSKKEVWGVTDEDGRVDLRVPPGQAEAWAFIEVGGVQFSALAVARLKPRSTSQLVLTLRPAASVVGRVFDGVSGLPIGHAQLSGPGALKASTDRYGRFVLDHWVTGNEGGILVSAEGYAQDAVRLTVQPEGSWQVPARFGSIGTEGADTPFVEIRLAPERVLIGRVIDSTGSPVPDVEIRAEGTLLVSEGYGRADRALTTSNDDGRFEVSGLHPEVTHTVWLIPQHGAAQSLLAPAGSNLVDLGTLSILEAASLVGQVVDSLGRPLAGFEVTARTVVTDPHSVDVDPRDGSNQSRDGFFRSKPLEVSTRTDVAGSFRFENLPASTIQVQAGWFAGNRATTKVRLLSGQATNLPDPLLLDEELETVHGRVHGPDMRVPLIIELIDPILGLQVRLPVEPDGAFEMRGLRAGQNAILLVRDNDEVLWEGVVDTSLSPLQIEL